MNYGELMVIVDGEKYFGQIEYFQGLVLIGKKVLSSWEDPGSLPVVDYELGYANFYDLDNTYEIEYAELYEVEGEIHNQTEYNWDVNVEIVSTFYDINESCLVVTFKK